MDKLDICKNTLETSDERLETSGDMPQSLVSGL